MRNVDPYGFTMPPWTPRPFTIEPMPCSRTPNGMFRPA
jgi:hypothetical protein